MQMKKYATLYLAVLLTAIVSFFIFVGCTKGDQNEDGGDKPQISAPIVTPEEKTAELGAEEDQVFEVLWNNGTFKEVKEGQSVLTSESYAYDTESLTIKGAFVATLEEGVHTFTLVTDGGSDEFNIKINDSRPADPTVTPQQTGAFNTLDPSDLIVYTVDWGKGTFESLAVGTELLENETDYMIEGNKLSIVGKGMIDGWDAGEYTFTLTTTTGSTTFDLTVVMSGSRYLDSKVFKEFNGESDVTFSMIIGTNTQITEVKEGENALDAASYGYDAQAQQFAFKKGYLENLSAGIHKFVISLDDSVAYTVWIATGTVLADNFENGGTNNEQITFGVVGNSNVSGAEAIDGKSVSLELEAPNEAGTLLEAKNIPLEKNRLYILHMTVRIDGKTQLIFVLPAQDGNQAWMNADGSMSKEAGQFVDSRSVSKEIEENVYHLKIYLPVKAYDPSGVNLKIYFRNGDTSQPAPQESTHLVVDNVYMAESDETFMPASAPVIKPDVREILTAQDVSFTVQNNYGTFVSLSENGKELNAPQDYSIEGDTLTVKAAYFESRSMTAGQTLTFTYTTQDPDKQGKTFTAEFAVTLRATVWNDVFEKEFDGENDVTFGMEMGDTQNVSVELNGVALQAGEYEVSQTGVTLKASYLKGLESNMVYQFKLIDAYSNEFRFAVYVGCTSETVLYEGFEDGTMPSADNFAIQMNRTLNRNSFDGSAATISGTGTLLFMNRSGFNEWSTPVKEGETYELSFEFRFAENGMPVAGSANDWGIFGGNKNIVWAFGNSTFNDKSDDGKYAYIEIGTDGELKLVKLHCVEDKTSLTKGEDGVYRFVLTFVAENNGTSGAEGIQVPCWNTCTFDIDNIMVRNVPGQPEIEDTAIVFDKSEGADITVPVSLHGGVLSEVRINGVAAEVNSYSLSGTVLTLKAELFADYDADEVLSLVIVTNGGISAAVTITIADLAPFFTDGNVYEYGPDDVLASLGLEANGHDIAAVKAGDTVIPAENYTFDPQTKLFAFTEKYLQSLEGTTEFSITFDGTAVELRFSVISKINKVVLNMDFEDGNAIAPIGQLGTQLDGLASLTQEIIEDNGSKALKITNVPEGLVTVYSTISSVRLDPSYLYMFRIDITVKTGVPVLFRFVEAPATSRDFFWIKADGTLEKNGLNPRYSLKKTDLGTGYVRYEIVAYATPTAANVSGNGNFEIATFAEGTGAFDVTLDNFMIAQTNYPLLQLDFEDENYKTVLGDGFGMSAQTNIVTGEESIGGGNSLHYTAAGQTNFLLLRPGNAYIGMNIIAGVKYKLSFKIQISNFPTNMNDLQMPIRSNGGDIGYVRPDPNAAGEPYIEVPVGTGYTAEKVVLDAEKDIYELSIVWTAPAGMTEIDFAIWGNVDMVVDDICLTVVH